MAKIPFGLFIFLLFFSPLAFGTVEPWSYTVMETLTVLACLVFFINTGKEKERVFYEVPGLVPSAVVSVLWPFAACSTAAGDCKKPVPFNISSLH